jgi:hypothetical protein
MQHPKKHTCNVYLKKHMKHLEQILATYMYSYCNMCNIPIYFCNIHLKHLQHTSETSETIKLYACNMRFQRNISLLLGRMKARWRVEFTGASGLATLVGSRPPMAVARRGREASAARRGGRQQPHDWERQPCAALGRAASRASRFGGDHALRLAGPAAEHRRQ